MPRAAILLNGKAGNSNPQLEAKIRTFEGERARVYSTSETSRALDAGHDFWIVIGGDGTLHYIINRIMQEREQHQRPDPFPAFLPLPFGSGNGVCSETGTNHSLIAPFTRQSRGLEFLHQSLEHETFSYVTIPLMRIISDQEAYGIIASVGLDAEVAHQYNQNRGKSMFHKGLSGYLLAVYKSLGINGRTYPLTTSMDGEMDIVLASMIAFGTSSFYGYGLRAFPHAAPLREEGKMQARIVSAPRWRDVAHLVNHVHPIFQGTYEGPAITDYKAHSIVVESMDPVPLQIAGDCQGRYRRVECSVMPEMQVKLIDGRRL